MKQYKWFYHPVFIFTFSTIALGTSLFLYIYWYTKASKGIETLVRKFNIDPGQVLSAETWVVVVILSVLVTIILIGIFTIFVYGQKTLQLYRLQNNFINNFTHELKTPVTSLKLYLETFLRHDLSHKEQKKYIQYMLQDVGRLSENINRILNLARIESKSYSGEFVETELISFIKDFYQTNRHLFQNIDIHIHPPEFRTFRYRMNTPLFEMLLINLTTNAVKYNRSGSPRLDISFKRMRGQFHIRFTDNGIGMDKGDAKKVFRKFYQIGRSENMTARGSGIGLYLVNNIARIHKGRMTAESEGEDQGSTLSLTLPQKKEIL